jgi:WG containing repeat
MRHFDAHRKGNPRKGNFPFVGLVCLILLSSAAFGQSLLRIGDKPPYTLKCIDAPFVSVLEVDSFVVLSKNRIAIKSTQQPGFRLYTAKLEALSSMPVEEVRPGREGIYPFRFEGLWGLADSMGKVIVKPKFTDAGVYSEGRIGLRDESCWGFASKTGKWLIKPKYHCEIEDVRPEFSCSRALVYDPGSGGWKYIDTEGKFINQRAYPMAFPFRYNHAWVQENDGFYLINQQGEIKLGPFLDIVPDPGSPLVPYLKNDLFGFVDVSQAKLLTNAEFLEVSGHHLGTAAVLTTKGWTLLNASGKTCTLDYFESLEFAEEGVFVYTSGEPDDRWAGITDRNCMIVVPAIWKSIGTYHQGVAAATKNGVQYELIDLEGNSLIKGAKFDRCSNPIGGCMIVQLDGMQQVVQLKEGALVPELVFPLSESLKIVPLN